LDIRREFLAPPGVSYRNDRIAGSRSIRAINPALGLSLRPDSQAAGIDRRADVGGELRTTCWSRVSLGSAASLRCAGDVGAYGREPPNPPAYFLDTLAMDEYVQS
jgi:hypothetical protein